MGVIKYQLDFFYKTNSKEKKQQERKLSSVFLHTLFNHAFLSVKQGFLCHCQEPRLEFSFMRCNFQKYMFQRNGPMHHELNVQSWLSQMNLVELISVVGPRLKLNIQQLAQLSKWPFFNAYCKEKKSLIKTACHYSYFSSSSRKSLRKCERIQLEGAKTL